MLFVLGAFLCAGFGQPVPTSDAAPMGAMAGMVMDTGDTGSVPMPCKSNLPDCFSGIGCIFVVALPPGYTPTETQLAWSRIIYVSVAASHAGMSLEPDIGPPIHA